MALAADTVVLPHWRVQRRSPRREVERRISDWRGSGSKLRRVRAKRTGSAAGHTSDVGMTNGSVSVAVAGKFRVIFVQRTTALRPVRSFYTAHNGPSACARLIPRTNSPSACALV